MAINTVGMKPYYDDFNPAKQFYKVLFRPGRGVQARELNTLQSILQHQLGVLGDHVFKDGDMVTPGRNTVDFKTTHVKLYSTFNGVRVTPQDVVGMVVVGKTSGVSMQIVAATEEQGTNPATIIGKVIANGGVNLDVSSVIANEVITVNSIDWAQVQNVASPTGGATVAHIEDGAFYKNGYFCRVNAQTIVVDAFSSTPSAKIYLEVVPLFVSESDDPTLLDPAMGSSNFMAPGAHRYKMDLVLVSRPHSFEASTQFIELASIQAGVIESQVDRTAYGEVMKVLAQRTYQESGNYVSKEYGYDLLQHLNSNNNGGVYLESEGGLESKLVMRLHPGSAMINGYEVSNGNFTHLAIDKARTTQQSGLINTPVNPSNYMLAGDLTALPLVDERPVVELWDTTTPAVGSSSLIGFATACGLDYHSGDVQDSTSAIYKMYLNDVHLVASGKLKGFTLSSAGSGYVYGTPSVSQCRFRFDQSGGTSAWGWLTGSVPSIPAGSYIYTSSGVYIGTTIWQISASTTPVTATTGAGVTVATTSGSATITLAGATPAMAIGTEITVNGVYVGTLSAAVLANATTATLTNPATSTIAAQVYSYTVPSWAALTATGTTIACTLNSRSVVFAGSTPAMPAGTSIYVPAISDVVVLSAPVLANATSGTIVEPARATGTSTYNVCATSQPVGFAQAINPSIPNMYGQQFVFVPPTAITVSGDGAGASGLAYVTNGSVTRGVVAATGADYTVANATVGSVWTASTRILTNQQVQYLGKLYTCTVSGITGTTGPTHTVGSVANGTATLVYAGVPATMVPQIYKYSAEDVGSIRAVNYSTGTTLFTSSVLSQYGVTSVSGAFSKGLTVYGGTDNKAVVYRNDGSTLYTKRFGNSYWDEIPLATDLLTIPSKMVATGTINLPILAGVSTVISGSSLPTAAGSSLYYNNVLVGTVDSVPTPTSTSITLTSPARIDIPTGSALNWCSPAPNASAQANSRSVMADRLDKSQISKIPANFVKTLRLSGTNAITTNTVVSRIFNSVVLDSTGSATLSCSTNEEFYWYSNTAYYVYQRSTKKFLPTNGFIRPGTTANQIVLEFGSMYANETLDVYTSVLKKLVAERAKTLLTTSLTVNSSYISASKIMLGKSDGYTLLSVYDSGSPSTPASSSGTDITVRYNFSGGQQDGYCGQAFIALKGGERAPTGNLLITFTYFSSETSSGDIFTVDSYAGMNYSQIPAYRDESGNGLYLTDAIDYRPVANNRYCEFIGSTVANSTTVTITDSGFNTSGLSVGDVMIVGSYGIRTVSQILSPTTFVVNSAISASRTNLLIITGVVLKANATSYSAFPTSGSTLRPGTTVSFKFQNYLSRVDTVYAHSDGKISVLQGLPSETPAPPNVAETADKIKLYDVVIPAYTLQLSDVMVKRYDYKGYTMKDISNLERRITALEEYTALNLLEKKVSDLQIVDATTGLTRMKLGFSVDNFKSYAGSDISDSQYMMTIDPTLGTGNVTFSQDNLELVLDSAQSTSNGVNGNLLMLPWNEVLLTEQKYITTTKNVNPFAVFVWAGTIKLSPNVDIWTDIDRLPAVNITLAGQK